MTKINWQQILDDIHHQIKTTSLHGKVASYIPELSNVDPSSFGICLYTVDGTIFHAGQAHNAFTIQSIAKVIATALVFAKIKDELWIRVGKEPSGNAFNSLVQLEFENGKPRNPLINSGAIVVADLMISLFGDPIEVFLHTVRKLANDSTIIINSSVLASELKTCYRNAALANLMKSYDNIHNHVNDVILLYSKMCSIEMNCCQLAKTFAVFANHGIIDHTNEEFLSISHTKRLNAVMQTCGFYDEAGEFSYKVGLPGKSGVGGGIVAVLPQNYSVAVWSPILNPKGNSEAGMLALEWLTTMSSLSVF